MRGLSGRSGGLRRQYSPRGADSDSWWGRCTQRPRTCSSRAACLAYGHASGGRDPRVLKSGTRGLQTVHKIAARCRGGPWSWWWCRAMGTRGGPSSPPTWSVSRPAPPSRCPCPVLPERDQSADSHTATEGGCAPWRSTVRSMYKREGSMWIVTGPEDGGRGRTKERREGRREEGRRTCLGAVARPPIWRTYPGPARRASRPRQDRAS